MTTNPRITVITPSYNQAHFLRDTIESVLNQGYPNLEFFIIDGASTDNSVEIIKEYGDRIDWWESTKDEGQSHAINKGLMRATGEFISWLNSDDILLPNALNTVAELVETSPDIDVIVGAILLGTANGQISSYYRPSPAPRWCKVRGAMDLFQPSTFVRRTTWERIGPLRQDLECRMDVDLLDRLVHHDSIFGYSPTPLSFLRFHHMRKGSTWEHVYEKERAEWALQHSYHQSELLIARYIRRIQKASSGVLFHNFLESKRLRGQTVQEVWDRHRN